MMSFDKQEISATMQSTGFVPLLSHGNASLAQYALETAYQAGVRAFEYTNRQPNSFEVFRQLVKTASQLPGLALGIGTIMDAATTEKYIQAGAHFIISPILKPEMATVCHAHQTLWIPGCATLTEIVTAKELGAGIIKLFPGSILGPGFVKAILPVVPDLKLMITGGVEPTEKSISAWFGAGATCVGLGSQLFTEEILANQDWKKLEQTIRFVLEVISGFTSKGQER